MPKGMETVGLQVVPGAEGYADMLPVEDAPAEVLDAERALSEQTVVGDGPLGLRCASRDGTCLCDKARALSIEGP